jgi:hypothetical protein
MTDAEVEANARSDPDAQPTTAAFWKGAKVVWPETKQLTSLRIAQTR